VVQALRTAEETGLVVVAHLARQQFLKLPVMAVQEELLFDI
jgi:hypothetical protein